jgi:hypothetical protein
MRIASVCATAVIGVPVLTVGSVSSQIVELAGETPEEASKRKRDEALANKKAEVWPTVTLHAL